MTDKNYEIVVPQLNEEQLLMVYAIKRLTKVLCAKKQMLQSAAFAQCGRGLTPKMFQRIVEHLAKENFLTVVESERNKAVLRIVE